MTVLRALVLLSGLATALASLYLVGNFPHHEWWMFAVWGVVLAPPIVFALRAATGRGGDSVWRWPGRGQCVVFGAAAAALVAGALNYQFQSIPVVSDETAYRFQGRIIASGHLMAETPWIRPSSEPAPTDGAHNPIPVAFNHHLYQPAGWFVKYPLGLPFVLAGGQLAHAEWLVNPLLGALILVCAFQIGRIVFDPAIACVGCGALLLSPYFIGNSIGFMSHALCGALLAASFYFCFRAIDSRSLTPLAIMLVLLACAFHTRPYTAFLATAVLSLASLWAFRSERRQFLRVFAMLAGGGAAIVLSVMLYNAYFTGSPLLSPYSLYRNSSLLAELDVSPGTVARNALSLTRFSLQATLVSTVPGLLPLSLYGLWLFRKQSIKVWALGAYFPILIVGYSFNPMPSSSTIGERFWFEGFFAVALLGGAAVVDLVRRYRPDPATLKAIAVALIVAQTALGARLVEIVYGRRSGYTTITAAARGLADCGCAVFLDLKEPYVGAHLNLNAAEWRQAGVFYFVDPGPGKREEWAKRVGYSQWKVLSYDPQQDSVAITSNTSPSS